MSAAKSSRIASTCITAQTPYYATASEHENFRALRDFYLVRPAGTGGGKFTSGRVVEVTRFGRLTLKLEDIWQDSGASLNQAQPTAK